MANAVGDLVGDGIEVQRTPRGYSARLNVEMLLPLMPKTEREEALFAVEVTKTSGSAGDKTTQCSFVYTVKTLGGSGTGMTPKKKRPSVGKMGAPAAASIGLAYYDEDGDVQLFDANETLAPQVCP